MGITVEILSAPLAVQVNTNVIEVAINAPETSVTVENDIQVGLTAAPINVALNTISLAVSISTNKISVNILGAPSNSGGGVTTIDGISGAVTLVAGTNITITDNSPSAGDIKISASLPTNTATYTSPSTTDSVPYFTNNTGNIGTTKLSYSQDGNGNPNLNSSTGLIGLGTAGSDPVGFFINDTGFYVSNLGGGVTSVDTAFNTLDDGYGNASFNGYLKVNEFYVSSYGSVNTAYNTLDDGSGNASFSGGFNVNGNTYIGDYIFQVGDAESGYALNVNQFADNGVVTYNNTMDTGYGGMQINQRQAGGFFGVYDDYGNQFFTVGLSGESNISGDGTGGLFNSGPPSDILDIYGGDGQSSTAGDGNDSGYGQGVYIAAGSAGIWGDSNASIGGANITLQTGSGNNIYDDGNYANGGSGGDIVFNFGSGGSGAGGGGLGSNGVLQVNGATLLDSGYIYTSGDGTGDLTVMGTLTLDGYLYVNYIAHGDSAAGFFGATPVSQQPDGAGLTNNVTSGGTTNTIANYTSLTVYASDAGAIRNNIYQLARKVKIIDDALRNYGLLT